MGVLMGTVLAFQPLALAEKIRWLRAIMARPDAPPAAKLVAWALAEHHNRTTGQCNPSAERLAACTGLSVRGVQKAVGWLREAAAITVFDGGRRGLRRAANGYILVMGSAVTLNSVHDDVTPHGGPSHPERKAPSHPEQSALEPLIEPKKEQTPAVACVAESAAPTGANGADPEAACVWERAKTAIQAVKGATWVRAWLRDVGAEGWDGKRLRLRVASRMIRDQLAGIMGPELSRMARAGVPGLVAIDVELTPARAMAA